MPKFGLGKGLESLIPKKPTQPTSEEEVKPEIITEEEKPGAVGKEEVIQVDIEKISPNPQQPRKNFDESTLKELADSIKEHGIVQPLVVTKIGEDQFQLITGERRWQAAKLADLVQVPAIVREASEQQKLELSIIENIQRSDLNPMERARAYKRLVSEFGLTQEEVGKKLAKSRVAITNTLRLFNLPEEVQQAVLEGKLSEGHAKAILSLDTEAEQLALFRKVVLHNLSVRDVERGVHKIKGYFRKKIKDPYLQDLEKKLEETLGTKVNIKKRKEGGEIVIDFYSDEEMNGIIDKIVGEETEL